MGLVDRLRSAVNGIIERKPRFYSYENRFGLFLGDTPKEIIETLQHYQDTEDDVYVPKRSELERVDGLLEFDWADVDISLTPKQYVTVDICEGIRFNVYPNKFDEIVDFSRNARSRYSRGALFKSLPQSNCTSVFFPESVVQAMEAYDWEQHRGKMAATLDEQYGKIGGLYSHPQIATRDSEGRPVRLIPLGEISTEIH